MTMDDGIQITGCSNIPGGVIVVPASINGLPVVSIGYGALGLNEAAAVVLPDTVKTIENDAFLSSCFQFVELDSGVKYIGDMEFGSCSNLVELTIPDGCEALGEGIIVGCKSMVKLTVPASVTAIGDSRLAFTDDMLDMVVYTPAGSCAEEIATANGFEVVND